MKQNPVALSSDAFSKSSVSSEDKEEVVEAFRYLVSKIADISSTILSKITSEQLIQNPGLLQETLHRYGINMRYLGRLLLGMDEQAKGQELCKFVRAEILVRSMKQLILSDITQTSADAEDEIKEKITSHLHIFFISDPLELQTYYDDKLSKYIGKFEKADLSELPTTRTELPLQWIFNRLSTMLGINWASPTEEIFHRLNSGSRPITSADIESFQTKIKFVSAAESLSLGRADPQRQIQFFETQLKARETLLGSSHPYVAESLENFAAAVSNFDFPRANALLTRAIRIRNRIYGTLDL